MTSIAEAIKEIVKRRKINSLVHFTKLEHLNSILTNGLIPRSGHGKLASAPVVNDSARIDKHIDATSASISFPNYKYFTVAKISSANATWVVLKISPKVLWENECLFCPENASSASVYKKDQSQFRGPEGLEKLFAESLERHREKLGLHDHEPTNPQAEVLVFGEIPPNRIPVVYCKNHGEIEDVERKFPFLDIQFEARKDVFGPRRDHQFW